VKPGPGQDWRSVSGDEGAVRDVCLFLACPGWLPEGMGLGLYVSVGGAEWQYRCCVTATSPSANAALALPAGVGAATLGVSMEPLNDLEAKEGLSSALRADYPRRVALDLHRFATSFCDCPAPSSRPDVQATSAPPPPAVVAAATHTAVVSLMDRWINRFRERHRRDPDFLCRQLVDP